MLDRWLSGRESLGLALVRIWLGILMVVHGWGKVTGLAGFAGALEGMGFPAPALMAPLAAFAEFGGGLLLIVGALTRWAAIPVAITMLVASFKVHGSAFLAQDKGMEFPLTLALMAMAVFTAGAGPLSVDEAVARRRGAAT